MHPDYRVASDFNIIFRLEYGHFRSKCKVPADNNRGGHRKRMSKDMTSQGFLYIYIYIVVLFIVTLLYWAIIQL